MEKIDLKKKWKHLYLPTAKKVTIVDVPSFSFIMLDGRIEPGASPETSQTFQNAINALYSLSYTLKFMSKMHHTRPLDYTVMALEGLWWTDSGVFDVNKKNEWKWTMMIMQPEFITQKMYQQALHDVKLKGENPALHHVRFEPFEEGLCMQIMHIGPYAEEARTIYKMMDFASENGYTIHGKHHEIYIGDPRRAKPDRLRTVLRQPIQPIVSSSPVLDPT